MNAVVPDRNWRYQHELMFLLYTQTDIEINIDTTYIFKLTAERTMTS